MQGVLRRLLLLALPWPDPLGGFMELGGWGPDLRRQQQRAVPIRGSQPRALRDPREGDLFRGAFASNHPLSAHCRLYHFCEVPASAPAAIAGR